MLCLLLGGGALFLFVRWYLQPDPSKFLGVYGQPGKWYWLKFRLMRFVIGHRQKKSKAAKKEENLMGSEFGGTGKRSIDQLETRHELPKDKDRPVDAVFIDASNSDGWYFTLGTAQRKDDVINLFFILRIPGVGTYIAPEMLTDTNVKSVSESATEWKTDSGFRLSCDEPMKKWRVQFHGHVVESRGERIYKDVGAEPMPDDVTLIPASFDLEWTNFGDHFDFDQEVSPTSIGHSLAIEEWSRPLFDRLKSSHQTHYEQFGFLSGSLDVNLKRYDDVTMTSMRDHTIASHRNWSDIRRYIMMIYHLSDGTCIHTSVISMPETVFSHLEFGYIITPDKKKYAVDRVHFSLPHHGEDKKFPRKFHYSFEAAHLKYDVDVSILETVSFKMGLDQACQVNENMATFTANGLKGQGFAEVEYRIAPY